MSRSLNTKRISLVGLSLALLASLLLALGLPPTRAQKTATEKQVGPEVSLLQPASCNLIQNGDFSAGINYNSGASGSMPPSSVANWTQAFGSPQISPGPGCGGNTGYILMWGNKGVGEGIKQTGLSIQPGHTYRLSACVRHRFQPSNPTLPGYVRFNVRASNGPLATYTTTTAGAQIGVIGDPSNTPSITTPGITSTQWTFVTLANWTANNSYNTITINPENNNTAHNGTTVSWGDIDNICLQDIKKPCPALDPDFALTATLGSGNASSYQVTANVATALPPNAGFAWIVEEIDLVNGSVIGTPMVNPSAWWSTPMTNVFSGYTFVTGHKYRITRGVWGPCNDWTPISKTVFLCNNCRSAEIKRVPSTQLKPTPEEK